MHNQNCLLLTHLIKDVHNNIRNYLPYIWQLSLSFTCKEFYQTKLNFEKVLEDTMGDLGKSIINIVKTSNGKLCISGSFIMGCLYGMGVIGPRCVDIFCNFHYGVDVNELRETDIYRFLMNTSTINTCVSDYNGLMQERIRYMVNNSTFIVANKHYRLLHIHSDKEKLICEYVKNNFDIDICKNYFTDRLYLGNVWSLFKMEMEVLIIDDKYIRNGNSCDTNFHNSSGMSMRISQENVIKDYENMGFILKKKKTSILTGPSYSCIEPKISHFSGVCILPSLGHGLGYYNKPSKYISGKDLKQYCEKGVNFHYIDSDNDSRNNNFTIDCLNISDNVKFHMLTNMCLPSIVDKKHNKRNRYQMKESSIVSNKKHRKNILY